MKEYSRQPRKQRLANYNRNQHAQIRAMSAHLSDELLKEYSLVRSMTVRKGDTVKVVRGIFKGHTAKVAKVFPQKGFISIEEATLTKADGKKVARMFRPSNVILTKMDMTDPWRREKLSRFRTPGRPAPAEKEEEEKEEKKEKEEAAGSRQPAAGKEKEEAAEEKGGKLETPEPSEGKKDAEVEEGKGAGGRRKEEGGEKKEEAGDKLEKPERGEGSDKSEKPARAEKKEMKVHKEESK